MIISMYHNINHVNHSEQKGFFSIIAFIIIYSFIKDQKWV